MSTAEEFQNTSKRLYALADSDPKTAIAEARSSATWGALSALNQKSIRSAVLIDAGSRIQDIEAVNEGCDILRSLCDENPTQVAFHYNLANGLITQADLNGAQLPDWYLETATSRREARRLFMRAGIEERSSDLRARALTNLANALNRANRWVEAYDAYLMALDLDHTNAVASVGAAKVLLRCINRGIGNKDDLEAAAAIHIDDFRVNEPRLRQLAGEQAFQSLRHVLELKLRGEVRSLSGATDYERFVARNRLALSPTIVGVDVSLKRWDTLRINSLTEPIGDSYGIPSLFGMFNVLKADYLLARRMAFDACNKDIADSGYYADTLDYAVYGMRPTMLAVAQRLCIDILDKIAVATCEYLDLRIEKRSVSFQRLWFSSPQSQQSAPVWNPSLRQYIEKRNWAIVAFSEMALDIREDGFLFEKSSYRNSGTHRFIILHDPNSEPSRQSDYVDHVGVDQFRGVVIESLRLARAAIIYFVELIALEERHKEGEGQKIMPLDVPSHHWIRGEGD